MPAPPIPTRTREPPDPATWALLFDADKVGCSRHGRVQGPLRPPGPHLPVGRRSPTTSSTSTATSPPTPPPASRRPPGAGWPSSGATLGDDRLQPQRVLRRARHPVTAEPQKARPRAASSTAAACRRRSRSASRFAQAQRFYDRPEHPGPARPGRRCRRRRREPPEIDFHGYCASLGDYPRLLRPLGLAVDLLVEPPAGLKPPRAHPGARPDRARPTWRSRRQRQARPWTNFELRDRRFIPAPRDEEATWSTAPCGSRTRASGFRVHQIDVDGSALKTHRLRRQRRAGSPTT